MDRTDEHTSGRTFEGKEGSRNACLIRFSVISLVALSVRLVYLVESQDNPTFLNPINDSLTYHSMATRLAETGKVPMNFFFQSYLYPFFVSLVYATFGTSIWTVKILQAFLGALTASLTGGLATRIFGSRAGWVAGVTAALLGPLIFFEGELLPAGLAAFGGIGLLSAMSWAQQQPQYWWAWCAVGIMGALAILTRAEFLPFFVLASLWLLFGTFRCTGGQRWVTRVRPPLALAGSFALVIIPMSMVVYAHIGDFTFLPSSGMLNLYLGNHPDPEQGVGIRPGYEWETLLAEPIRDDPAIQTNRQAQPYWRHRLIENVQQHPCTVASGLARKAWLHLSTREIPRSLDIYVFREWSWILSGLVWRVGPIGFPMVLVLPLAAIGLVGRWRSVPVVLKLYLLMYSLAVIAVFAASRYRVPMLPVLAILAGGGIQWCIAAYHSHSPGRLAAAGGAAIALLMVLSPPFRAAAEINNYAAEMYLFLAADRGEGPDADDAEALCLLRRAEDLDPNHAEVQYRLATQLLRQGDSKAASSAAQRVLKQDPDHAGAHFLIGVLRGRAGERDKTIKHFQQAVSVRPDKTEWSYLLAQQLILAQRYQEARDALLIFLRYEQVTPKSVRRAVTMIQTAPNLTHEKRFELLVAIGEGAERLTMGSNPNVLELLASAYVRSGRFDDASQVLERAIKEAELRKDSNAVSELRAQADRLGEIRNRVRHLSVNPVK